MADDFKCPKCGSKMILRKVKKGSKLGKQSYLCERYPECKGEVVNDSVGPDFLGNVNIGLDGFFDMIRYWFWR